MLLFYPFFFPFLIFLQLQDKAIREEEKASRLSKVVGELQKEMEEVKSAEGEDLRKQFFLAKEEIGRWKCMVLGEGGEAALVGGEAEEGFAFHFLNLSFFSHSPPSLSVSEEEPKTLEESLETIKKIKERHQQVEKKLAVSAIEIKNLLTEEENLKKKVEEVEKKAKDESEEGRKRVDGLLEERERVAGELAGAKERVMVLEGRVEDDEYRLKELDDLLEQVIILLLLIVVCCDVCCFYN